MKRRSYFSPEHSSISIVRGLGEWFVRIVENDVQQTQAYEADAVACAQAFKARLGLHHIERL